MNDINLIDIKELNAYDRLLIINGCKPEWMPKWIDADLIFKSACEKHDILYWAGGCGSMKKKIDDIFLADMLSLIKEKKFNWFKRWIYNRAAKAYYRLVREWGDSTFQFRFRIVNGKTVGFALTAKDLPSYSPQVDFRFLRGCYKDIPYTRRDNRFYLSGEL